MAALALIAPSWLPGTSERPPKKVPTGVRLEPAMTTPLGTAELKVRNKFLEIIYLILSIDLL